MALIRPDTKGQGVPEGVEVVQLTHNHAATGCHIYMEAKIFTPDYRLPHSEWSYVGPGRPPRRSGPRRIA